MLYHHDTIFGEYGAPLHRDQYAIHLAPVVRGIGEDEVEPFASAGEALDTVHDVGL